MKVGRIVIVLNGRYAGKKAVVVKNHDDGTKSRPYGHCILAGIEKAPKNVTKAMGKKLIRKRTKVETFVKVMNYSHVMPTRYVLPSEIDPRKIVTDSQMDNPESRKTARRNFKSLLERKFVYPPLDKAGQPSKEVLYLKKKLRF